MKAKILIFFTTIIFFFVSLEIAIRIISPQYGEKAERVSAMPAASLTYDDKFGIKLKPNIKGNCETSEFKMDFRTNSKGIRGDDYGPKAPGVYRIFCLGDSMTFGYGVDEKDTFARLLSKRLPAAAADKRIEVINGGIPGYDIDRYGLVFKHIGLAYEPDLLILFFTISNDFGDEFKKGESVPIENTKKRFLSFRDIKEFFLCHSHLYSWVRNRLNSLSLLNMALIKIGLREVGDMYLCNYSDVMQSKVRRAESLFKEIYNEARINKCDMFVVAIPDSRQLSKGLRYNARYWDMDKPNRVLKEILEGIGIGFFDLLPVFKQEDGERFYYRVDGHLNNEGHLEVAKLVSEYIADNRLIK